jgi:hypothetical protein
MAQDLASAIVDLGVSAEKRRQGRRALRQSVDLIVGEILEHARVGDEATIRFRTENENDRAYRVYKVERVNWLVEPPMPHDEQVVTGWDPEPTLVQYRFALDADQDPFTKIFAPRDKCYGAVLLDVRHDLNFYNEDTRDVGNAKVVGRDLLRERLGHERNPYDAELHLATDDELLTFANEALDVVQQLAKALQAAQKTYATAAEKLAKLSPK